MKKHCLECHDTFVGRSDKKYCSDDCRSRYHHKQVPNSTAQIKAINRILKKNWKILSEIKTSGGKSVTRETLLMAGFSFQYCTHVTVLPNGKMRKYCYDIGYSDQPKRVFISA